ncbi:MAG TPA: T9SS type A sorting domain-containing protein, partial [Rhodothermales bacterium]|nr:T9SS type A sorting domain-containing protein [Rhodothermales bacterium]
TQVEVNGGNPPTPVGLTASLRLKTGTTVADASDVDAGYQIEMAIDLTTIPGLSAGTNVIYLATTFFDGDYLDPDDTALSYGTRSWWLVERGGGLFGGPAAMTYLDPSLTIVSAENAPGQQGPALVLLGAAPNPTSGTTAVRYVLPTSAAVTVEVFDALGRVVATVQPGVQPAGQNEVQIDGASLAAGSYVVRVRTADGAMETGRLTIAH